MADTREAVEKMIQTFNTAKTAIDDLRAKPRSTVEQRMTDLEETISKFRDAEAEIENVRAQLVNEWWSLIPA